jgi:hypothetical protein
LNYAFIYGRAKAIGFAVSKNNRMGISAGEKGR